MVADEVPKVPKKPFYRHGKGNSKKTDKRPIDGGDKTPSKSFRRSKTRSNNRRKDRGPKRRPPGVKLILRLLPPTLTKEQFLKTLEPVVGGPTSWKLLRWYYVQGYYTSKIFAEPVYSRCYLIFANMDQLKEFAHLVEPITFVDDKDNSARAVLKVSSYCESYDDDDRKPSRNSEILEGTLDQDVLFQTFLNSMKLLEQSPEYSYADVNVLKPLEKEMRKRKEWEFTIQKRSESALVALAGDNKPKKSKKKKKALKKENKESKTKKKSKKTKATSQSGEKGPRPTKSTLDEQPADNNNVVILEAAGKKELQRRKKIQDPSKPVEKAKTSKKNPKSPIKLLKKETKE